MSRKSYNYGKEYAREFTETLLLHKMVFQAGLPDTETIFTNRQMALVITGLRRLQNECK